MPLDRRIRVVVVDDSMAMRAMVRLLLQDAPDIEVVGEAADPYEARERIKALNPDVITLDVEMPRMNGLQFLDNLMRLRPTPVVMFSSLTARGAAVSMQALALGAVEVLQKPGGSTQAELAQAAFALTRAIRAAAGSRPRRSGPAPDNAVAPVAKLTGEDAPLARRVICIGASTGGTEAIREVLQHWTLRDVAVLITQHIPAGFSTSFAERLDRHAPLRVHHAVDGDVLRCGHAYVAPGGMHLRMRGGREGFAATVSDDAPVNRHRPSVDVLFASATRHAAACAAAVLLTGMGDDGARELLRLRTLGVHTVVQDEASSVVWGMPGSAVRFGAADRVLPLDAIAAHLAVHAAQSAGRRFVTQEAPRAADKSA